MSTTRAAESAPDYFLTLFKSIQESDKISLKSKSLEHKGYRKIEKLITHFELEDLSAMNANGQIQVSKFDLSNYIDNATFAVKKYVEILT